MSNELLARLESFDWDKWNTSLAKGIMQPYRDVIIKTAEAKAAELNVSINMKDPLLQKFMTKYVMERATQINGTTKELVREGIRTALAENKGLDLPTLTQKVLDIVRERFKGYEVWRAARIARTEPAIAYNQASVLGYAQAGVTEVEMVDGTLDEVCREANGKVVKLREALADPIGHPNCTRSLVAVLPEDDVHNAIGPVELLEMAIDDLPWLAAVSEFITSLDDPCNRSLDAIDEE